MKLGLWAWKSLTCIQMWVEKRVSGTERKKLWPRTVDWAVFRLDMVVDQMEINIAEFIYTFISSHECTKSPPWSGYRSVTGHGTIMSSEDQKTFTLLLLDPQHQVLESQCHRNDIEMSTEELMFGFSVSLQHHHKKTCLNKKVGRHLLPNFKLYYKSTINKPA